MTIPRVPTVSVTDLPTEPGSRTVLLDVREVDEWELGHAPGAQHIPIIDVPARTDEIDIDAEVFVVCRQGGRSIVVVEFLNSIGFDAYNVDGGMVAWQQAGLPLISDGDPGSAKIY
ncbi:rhodanese-like domain-containing protein [Rhodococcus spongiicola]|uniref:rhodanese-like domain-containing protein n=1 Tax=Rhodococcus spongiicola TaxID=2487352 RepID=UPI001F390CFE|nr:rhodanese-like domain-containing protein [Rhodococcus spongiicola]